jgi:hypothetical protein
MISLLIISTWPEHIDKATPTHWRFLPYHNMRVDGGANYEMTNLGSTVRQLSTTIDTRDLKREIWILRLQASATRNHFQFSRAWDEYTIVSSQKGKCLASDDLLSIGLRRTSGDLVQILAKKSGLTRLRSCNSKSACSALWYCLATEFLGLVYGEPFAQVASSLDKRLDINQSCGSQWKMSTEMPTCSSGIISIHFNILWINNHIVTLERLLHTCKALSPRLRLANA